MYRAACCRLLITLAVAAAGPIACAADGSVDLGWGGPEAGRVRVPFDLGANFLDSPTSVRVLADGRLVSVGGARDDGGTTLAAVVVRNTDGTADSTIAPGGRYVVAASGITTNSPTAIAADGSWYIAGVTSGGAKLRISHYALDGTPIGAPVDIGEANTTYSPDTALLDAAGRLLVGGHFKPVGAGDSSNDGFVLRLTTAGALDPGFGIRTIQFDASRRDDVYAMTEVGDGTYAVCGRVGDLVDSSMLGFGIAHLGGSGNLLTAFNGTGMYVDQLALQGHAAESGCTGIAAVPSPEGQRIVITGRAAADTVYPRTFLLVVDATTGATLPGTPDMLDFGEPSAVLGFPVIRAGAGSGDRGLVYVAMPGKFDASGAYSIAVARVDPFGNYDANWGDTAQGTKIVMSVPAIGGPQRDLYVEDLTVSGGRVYLAGSVNANGAQNFDFALVRLTGDTIFADAFDF